MVLSNLSSLYRGVQKSAESGLIIKRVSMTTIKIRLNGVALREIDKASPAGKVKATVSFLEDLIVTVLGSSIDD